MPANEDRKYTQIIDYVVDQVGADVDRDLLKVAIGAQDDPSTLDQNIKSIGGTDQSGGDLIAALQSVSADDELRLRLFAEDDTGNLSEIQGEELGTTLSGTETAVITSMAEVLETVGNTEARMTVYAEDSTGALQQIQAGSLGTAPNGTETAVVTIIARALAEVGQTEVRTRVHGLDDADTLQEAQVESLASGIGDGTYVQLTYLARALNSKSLDEFVSRVTDSTGSQIDPLTQDSTQAVGNTELRSRVFGPDSGGALQQVNTEAFDTALAATDIGLATYMARALEGIGEDHLQAALYADDPNNALSRLNVNSNGELRTDAALDAESVFIDANDDNGNTLNPGAEALQENVSNPVGLVTYLSRSLQQYAEDELRTRVHQSDGTQVDPATQALETALKTNGSDEFVVRITGSDGQEVVEQSLDTDAVGADIGLLTFVSRALNSIGQDELVSRLADDTGAQIHPDEAPQYPDAAAEQDLIGTGDLAVTANVKRSEAVLVSANSDDNNNWSASVTWEDENGNVVQNESSTDIGLENVDDSFAEITRKGPVVVITFTDESGGSQNNINTYVDVHR